jgi:hypothetical protein
MTSTKITESAIETLAMERLEAIGYAPVHVTVWVHPAIPLIDTEEI